MKRKIILKTISFVLAFLLLGSICTLAITKGLIEQNLYGWFDKYEKCDENNADKEKFQPTITDGNGNAMDNPSKVYPLSSRMFFSPSTALLADSTETQATEQTVKVEAEIQPYDAVNKEVDWAIAFVNPASNWASGKTVTDYVTVTSDSDGSLTATVTCLKAFGEQIKITVTSRENPNVSAVCTVDYLKKILDVGYKILKDGVEVNSFTVTESGSDYTFCLGEIKYSEGSLEIESLGYERLGMTIQRSKDLFEYLRVTGGFSYVDLGSRSPLSGQNTIIINSSIRNVSDKLLFASKGLYSSTISKLREILPDYTGSSFEFSYSYYTANQDCSEPDGDSSYTSKVLFEKVVSLPVVYELDVPVTGISLDNSSITF